MKGLIITFLVVVALIGVGLGNSVFVHTELKKSLDTAYQGGLDEGYAQAYQEGAKKGREAGFQAGVRRAFNELNRLEDSLLDDDGLYFLYNPTYDEVRNILTQVGMGSVEEILDYTRANGIRAAYVRVALARQAPPSKVYLYQLLAFETLDKGLITIEPWSHREVKVAVGRKYSELNGFPASPYDDTITKVSIVW